jgi:hypothetical protein
MRVWGMSGESERQMSVLELELDLESEKSLSFVLKKWVKNNDIFKFKLYLLPLSQLPLIKHIKSNLNARHASSKAVIFTLHYPRSWNTKKHTLCHCIHHTSHNEAITITTFYVRSHHFTAAATIRLPSTFLFPHSRAP